MANTYFIIGFLVCTHLVCQLASLLVLFLQVKLMQFVYSQDPVALALNGQQMFVFQSLHVLLFLGHLSQQLLLLRLQ